MSKYGACFLGTAALAVTLCLSASEPDMALRGRELFQRRCAGCHSLDKPKVGPALKSVFARHAAADPRFIYSEALKQSGLLWDEVTLDRWLKDPDALVPDNDMSFRLNQADERTAIIAYLKQVAAKEG